MEGLYAVTDDTLPRRERFLAYIEASLEGGVDLLQLRLKRAPRGEIVKLGKEVLLLTKRYGIPLFVNDDPEVAVEIGAEGVHLGRKDASVRATKRRYGASLLVGASAYGDVELARVLEGEGADYIAFGNFFLSPVKPEEKRVPLSLLKVARNLLKVPIFAIGGINHKNAHLVLREGAHGIAVVSAIFNYPSAEEVVKATRSLREIVERYTK